MTYLYNINFQKTFKSLIINDGLEFKKKIKSWDISNLTDQSLKKELDFISIPGWEVLNDSDLKKVKSILHII